MGLRRPTISVAVCLVAFALLSVAGCGRKEFTPEDFKKVQKGMSEAELKETLGTPIETLESIEDSRRHSFKSGDNYYSVSVVKGKVEEPMGPMNKKDYDESQAMFRGMIEMLKKLK